MVDVKAWAGCICSLTQLVCTPATPLIACSWYIAADMAQHLVPPTSPSHNSHIQVLVVSGGLGMVTGSIPDICCSLH
jgi:hypothetical protein